jgi:pSer/pThr/pTyr-binding forkhead associated (FHA) protein
MSNSWSTRFSSSGRIFYYNTETKEKTFRKPQEFTQPQPVTTPVEYTQTPDPRYLLHQPTGHYYEIETRHFWKWDKGQYVNLSLQGKSQQISKSNKDIDITKTKSNSERIKLVVKESKLLECGGIVVVDENGLKFGRDKQDQLLCLKELEVSRYHSTIYYMREFLIIDVGSTHGTFLNGIRMSESKLASDPVSLCHQDIIKIGSTTFQVHMHLQGYCEDCDVKTHTLIPIGNSYIIPIQNQGRISKKKKLENERVQEMNRLKSSLGIEDYIPQTIVKDHRKVNQILKNISMPMIPSSSFLETKVKDEITKKKTVDGIGKEMLQKMGWTIGTGLGKHSKGIVEPIRNETVKFLGSKD